MPNLGEPTFTNLNEISISSVHYDVAELLVPDEKVIQAFQNIRDQLVFTDKRLFIINVQGITGKRVSYFSYPYSKVLYYGIDVAGGPSDNCSILRLTFINGSELLFFFNLKVNIRKICAYISKFIL